ncbi:MAG: oxygen-independent coproporphyrinogen III oxidase [Bacteroidetes bacterium]|jgi:oxygen-independent coproporphyrinogen-3 oxidase|nr:oxygen-independent coproporphyrinogen III oxidase [Bacteroidota bacterium]
MTQQQLLEKYNVPVPRYTSYPTVPYWNETPPAEKAWKQKVVQAFQRQNEISLYLHLPFCEALCTYCGCNKRITKNHAVESPYIEAVLKEWRLYRDLLPGKPVLRELHLGGGTPTFFSPQNLHHLLSAILEDVDLAEQYEFGFEAHPGTTSPEHLQVLRELGFTRLSIGIQDFAPEILAIINRKQTFEDVVQVTKRARELGYESINYDLIFGLPLQTKAHVIDTVKKVKALLPERIAFYSYAHVPWISPSQRAYSEADLPTGEEKRELYELGCELLEEAGYIEIGMDHFALPKDSLCQAMEAGHLHRNFMGYTPFNTELNLALGASSISDSWDGYIQNEKKIERYQEIVDSGRLPIIKGHLLSGEDEILRHHILNLMCRHETSWQQEEQQCAALYAGIARMDELERDGLVKREPYRLTVEPAGYPFIRNIALALDARYWRRKPEGALFSQSV